MYRIQVQSRPGFGYAQNLKRAFACVFETLEVGQYSIGSSTQESSSRLLVASTKEKKLGALTKERVRLNLTWEFFFIVNF